MSTMDDSEVTEAELHNSGLTSSQKRNLVSFWIFGLTNNFAYVIMLSAANDILREESTHPNITNASIPVPLEPSTNRTGKLLTHCNPIGTGAILLADIIPALVIKLIAPFFIDYIPYGMRIVVVIISNAASFPIVAYSQGKVWMSIIGVMLASFGSGLGEITFLSLSSFFDTNSVSTWSSGTGAAGVLGALSYAGLTALGVSPPSTIMMMLVVPALMAGSYFILLVKPPKVTGQHINSDSDPRDTDPILVNAKETPEANATKKLTSMERCLQIKNILKYMIPLGLVYFAEYFINQALFEIIYFENTWLPVIQQYRWYQVIYQIGVFISRSSVNIVQINKIWILPCLQFATLTVLLCQVFFSYIPSIWIVFFIILFEGLLGGGAYVNTFYKMSKEVPEDRREFSLGAASVSDSLGIALAGAVAVPVHDLICKL